MMQPAKARGGMLQRVSASAVAPPPAQPSTQPVLPQAAPTTQPEYREGHRLDPNFYGMQFAYVKADFECDGIGVKDVGLKQRGNSSYNWSASGYKRPFKVDFNRFVDGQKYLGLTAFHLNNNAFDPSQLRETLGYELFRQLGVPAPRTTYAVVYLTIDGKLDREYVGLYTLIEEIDSKAFLRNHFGSSKGFLMKPWNMRGFPYFGEQWSPYDSRYNPRSDPTEATARRTIEFVKLVNYSDDATFDREIDKYLNVDVFLRFLAGQVMLSNLDNILFTGHNFYFYLNPKDSRFYLMPWDLNLAFANFTSAAPIDAAVHLSILRPHSGEAKIIDRLLAIPKYRQQYRDIITSFMASHFNADKLFARIDALQSVMARESQLADEAWKAKQLKRIPAATTRPALIPTRPAVRLTGWQGGQAIELKEFVTRRVASLNEQLAGESDGYSLMRPQAPLPSAGALRTPEAFGNLPPLTLALIHGADTNYDNEINRKEMRATIQAFFAEADSRRENSLTQAALAGALNSSLQNATRRRSDRSNRSGWGAIFRGTSTEPAVKWAGAISRSVNNGAIGPVRLEQLLAAADKAFDAADRDKSGRLDAGEILTLLGSLAMAPDPATRPVDAPPGKK